MKCHRPFTCLSDVAAGSFFRCLLAALTLLLCVGPAWAQGNAFTYQGSLADGSAAANGTYDLRLTVFDAAIGGNVVGNVTELPGQVVAEGLFTVTIDPGTGVFTGPGRWLELQVRSTGAPTYTTIAPRQALTPTPYAIRAASAATAGTATVATTANSVPATGITGELPLAQLPASVVVNGTSGLTLTKAPELVGQSSLAGGALSVLAGEHYAGIAAGNAGLLIFDVANPAAPALVSQFNQGVFTHGFTVDKDHAFLASGANGLRTFSLTNIAAPEFLSETNDTEAHQVVTDGNYAYVAGVPNTVVYSLADRSHPEKIAVVGAPNGSTRRLALANTTLFVAGANALRVYSVATPASPVQLANVPVMGARSVALSGQFAFVACGPTGVAVFDVANPANPTLIGEVPVDADAQHVYASANRLYVSDHGAGLQEWDITAPAAPVHLRTFASVPNITGSIVLNNYAMTANSDAIGLRIVGLSQAVNFAAGHAGNGASGNAVGVTIGGGGARTYLVQNDQGEQNVGGPNVAGGDFSTIVGGLSNTVAQAAHGAVIAGGAFNTIGTNATVAAIGGGAGNRIGTDARNAVIAGGDNNLIGTNATSAFIGGGERNEIAANARGATIPGGYQNRAAGERSFAAGQQAKADHRGAFVWADANGGDFLSTAENQFSVRARGGVRFETGGAGVLVDGQPLGASGAARLNGGNTFTGNQTVNGSVSATSFTGNGFNLTSLNAANLAAGTVPDARLSANVPLLTAGKLSDTALSADVARRAGGNTFTGDQTVVGAISATSFAGAGSALTGLSADNLSTGTVPEARLSPNVPLLTAGKLNDAALSTDVARRAGGNAFLGDQLVTGALSATSVSGNGAGLTSLNASGLASGTVPDARLSANVATRSGGNAFTGDQSVIGAVSATSLSGNGSGLTSLNAASLAAGTVPDARLSANVPLLAAGKLNDSALSANVALRTGGNAFNGNQTVAGTVTATEFVGNGAGLTGLPGGNSVQVVSGASVAAAPNTTYVANSASPVTVTLPSTSAPGDWVRVSGLGTGGWGVSGDVTINPPGEAWTVRAYAPNPRSLASSADGTQLVAASFPGRLYTSADSGVTWIPREADHGWISVASAGDGSLLVAAVNGGQLYTSADQGVSWTARESNRAWVSVASVADGSLLVAAASGGQIYISTDRGVTWMARESNRAWFSLAAVADGSVLIAAVNGGQLHTSTDRGLTWTARESNRSWISVASAADGSLLVAATESLGQLHVSTDRGVTWVVRGPSLFWSALALSANGTRLIGVGADLATSYLPELRTSVDGGVTWTTRESGRSWRSVASSSDGRKLVAGEQDGALFTSVPTLLQGGQGDSVELRFTANGDWLPVAPNELNAANLSTGTLPDARLSADVARRNGGNTFSGDQTVNGGLQVRHGSTATTPWPVRIENTSQATFLGGLRLSDAGFLEVANTARNGGGFARLNSGGSWTAVSDRRLKTDIAPAEPLLEPALALRPVRFHYRAEPDGPLQLGFIAQEVEAILPTLVTDGADVKTLDYASLSVVAIGAIQELNTKLEAKLAAKDAEVAELKSRLEKLERLVNEKLGGGQ
jgi:hypothetical protein